MARWPWWSVSAVLLATYQVLAHLRGWTTVSRLQGWRALVRDVWWLGLGAHFWLERQQMAARAAVARMRDSH